MKRTITALIIAAAFFFGQGAAAYAKENAPRTVEGSVTNISSNMVTINPEGIFSRELKLEIDNNTDLGALSSVQELKTGDNVHVEYYEQNGKNIASHVMKAPMEEKTKSQTY